jgi:hypothetical protein
VITRRLKPSKIPDAAGASPYTYWGLGFTDLETYRGAEKAGRP